MKRILFITQDLGRTGSEMLLWYSLLNLNRAEFTSYVFCKQKGILIDQLPAYVKWFIAYKKSKNLYHKILRGVLKICKIDPLAYQLKQIQKKIKADFWYVNTIANPEVYDIARKLGIKIITHFHELPMAYSFITYHNLEKIINYSSGFIGCSEVVCEKIRNMGAKNVELLYGFIDQNRIKCSKPIDVVRTSLGFKSTDFIWVISGKTTLIKGIDFLIPLLGLIPANAKILWIGGEEPSGTYYYVSKTITAKFPDRVKFIGAQEEDYYNYFNCGNAFLLLSREDSFPLVMLEAASLGKPIVGFNSGGIKEFIHEDTGIVVDQGDFENLAEAMNLVAEHPEMFNVNSIKMAIANHEVTRQVNALEDILRKFSLNN